MNEADKIKERYKLRTKTLPVYALLGSNFQYIYHVICEREYAYSKALIDNGFNECSPLKLLEVGAGNGSNLLFFKKVGFSWENMTAIELIEERAATIKRDYPGVKLMIGDAALMDESEKFDVVFQSTVFTSILDSSLKTQLAAKMLRLVKPGGIIIWYDFVFDNPSNKDVKSVKKGEIRQLFSGCSSIEFKRVTLAPPLGRRIGVLYPIVNFLFPFLRSHVVATIKP